MGIFGWSYPPGAADDPYAPYNQDEVDDMAEHDCEALRKRLRELSTNKWRWDRIDYCATGKDADLEPWGRQGVEVVCCDDTRADCIAHIGKTFSGLDVALNLPFDTTDADIDRAMEIYLDQAAEVICGCNVAGDWDGDAWYLSESIDFSVDLVFTDSELDVDATAAAIVERLSRVLEPVEKELVLADNILNDLAGWTEDGKQCEDGKPGKYSAWLVEGIGGPD